MISSATKLSRIVRTTPSAFSLYKTPPPHFLSPPPIRFFSTNQEFKVNPVAVQTINYAYSLARSLKTDDSYGQGLLVLEQCESNQTDDNSKGLVLLAMSKLLSERGHYDQAIEKLEKITGLNIASVDVGVIVAVSEALVGLRLELGEDDGASESVDASLQVLDDAKQEFGCPFMGMDPHMRALKGLVELLRGNLESLESYFKEARDNISSAGNAALSYAELLHTKRDFSSAKELYQKMIQVVPEKGSDQQNLTADNIVILPWADLSVAATCALGQLEAHMGNFADAEEILTRALTKTEELLGLLLAFLNLFHPVNSKCMYRMIDRIYLVLKFGVGSHHPKVGVVLTCIALMFRYKATVEHSSSLMIQEGLYRRAIEVLKAPPLETPVAETKVHKRDIIALARGGYAETLCVQQNRKAEGERMKSWAETAWRNRRLSLAEALDISEPSSKVPVIDVRISRVL